MYQYEKLRIYLEDVKCMFIPYKLKTSSQTNKKLGQLKNVCVMCNLALLHNIFVTV